MRAIIHFIKPDDIQVRLTMDLPLKEWRELRAAIELADIRGYPAYKFLQTIGNAVSRCEERFYADAVQE